MNVKGEESQALQQGVTLIFFFFFFLFFETDAPIASSYHNSMGDSLFSFCDTQTSRDNLLAPLFSVSLITPAYLPADT